MSQYYKNIYSKGQVNDYPAINNIEGFLGEDVLNRPEVQNAKLSEAEKIELDAPLTLEELTKSINKANLKSTPGPNGISNKFIKRYWDFLKHPLLKYANFAYTSVCRACLHSFFIDRQSARELWITRIPRDAVI